MVIPRDILKGMSLEYPLKILFFLCSGSLNSGLKIPFILIDTIRDSKLRNDEIPPIGHLLFEYAGLMEECGYEDLDEMCNIEGLDWSEIFDDEPKEYGSECKREFIDETDKPDMFGGDRDDCQNDAYYEGRFATQKLRVLLNCPKPFTSVH